MAKDHALDIMNQDRNYWRTRCLESEKERDEARDDAEFYMRQWQGVQAIARETMERVKGDRAKPIDDDDTVLRQAVKRLGIKFGADSRAPAN